jgi:hypothetical protein
MGDRKKLSLLILPSGARSDKTGFYGRPDFNRSLLLISGFFA